MDHEIEAVQDGSVEGAIEKGDADNHSKQAVQIKTVYDAFTHASYKGLIR